VKKSCDLLWTELLEGPSGKGKMCDQQTTKHGKRVLREGTRIQQEKKGERKQGKRGEGRKKDKKARIEWRVKGSATSGWETRKRES